MQCYFHIGIFFPGVFSELINDVVLQLEAFVTRLALFRAANGHSLGDQTSGENALHFWSSRLSSISYFLLHVGFPVLSITTWVGIS